MDNSIFVAYIDRVKSGDNVFYYLGKTMRVGADKWKKIRIKFRSRKITNNPAENTARALTKINSVKTSTGR